MLYQFSYRHISQKFTRPVITNHGIWEIRESLIIRLIDLIGQIGWGEIAPIGWFGSETLAQALDFCHQLPREITSEMIFDIPDKLPACQFGFESALENLQQDHNHKFINYSHLNFSGLLTAGKPALNQWQSLWKQGYKTFKWKIGVNDIKEELEIFNLLIDQLPESVKLRLDANGGLDYNNTKLWLKQCDYFCNKIEFIEQPLPVDKFSQMLHLSNYYNTKIALDESIATLQQLENCYQQNWQGVFVIKPSIVGSPSKLRKFCEQNEIDMVFSSVFETAIGRQAALKLAVELSRNNRPLGFGINHYFTQPQANLTETL